MTSVRTAEKSSHSADKAPGMALCRIADTGTVNHHSTRFAHTADRCTQSPQHRDRGKYLAFAEHSHRTLRGLHHHVHHGRWFRIRHIRLHEVPVAVEGAAASGAGSMAVLTSQ